MLKKIFDGQQDKDGFVYAGWQPKENTIALYFLSNTTPKSAVLEIPKAMYNNVVTTAQNSGFKQTVSQVFTLIESNASPELTKLMYENYTSLPAHLFKDNFASEYADRLTKMVANCYVKGSISLGKMEEQIASIKNTTQVKQNEAKSM